MQLHESIVRHLAFPKFSTIDVRERFMCSDYVLHLECEYMYHVWSNFKLYYRENHVEGFYIDT